MNQRGFLRARRLAAGVLALGYLLLILSAGACLLTHHQHATAGHHHKAGPSPAMHSVLCLLSCEGLSGDSIVALPLVAGRGDAPSRGLPPSLSSFDFWSQVGSGSRAPPLFVSQV